MELPQLRDFAVLAEELHYARVAAGLGMDQSPLSRRIKELERDLGILLFARTSRGTQLTPIWICFLPWARAILGAYDRTTQLLQTSNMHTTIRVLLSDDVPHRNIFSALSIFQKGEPRSACFLRGASL